MGRRPAAGLPATGILSALAAAALFALTACSAGSDGQTGPGGAGTSEGAGAPAAGGAWIAGVAGDRIEVRAEPGGEVLHTLGNPNELGADRVFLVREDAGEWLEVLLPVRPNGSTGWVRRDEVELSVTSYRVEIDLSEFSFAVLDGGEEVLGGVIGTGDPETPTPPGDYYFTELVRPPEPGGPYGAYAFGLSGYSETLESFAGGPGQLAVHGTDDEAALGSRVSHGCIRVSDDDITWMAENLPLGTPVSISE